jgi:hypothetical protein
LGLKLKGSVLTITADLDKASHASFTGKSEVIGTTGGNLEIADGVILNVNLYRPLR